MRPGNADLNMTIGLAHCGRRYGMDVLCPPLCRDQDVDLRPFRQKANPQEVPKIIYILLFPIFFMVGLIEVVSIIFRPVSFPSGFSGTFSAVKTFSQT
jgi:F-type H+-transporting ATPase subunit a